MKEVRDVADAVARLKYPILMAGDLNTMPTDAPCSKVDSDGNNAFESFELTRLSFSPDGAPQSHEFTFSSMRPQSVIDWILFERPELQLLSQRVITSKLSDHYPVIAEFVIQ